MVYGLWFMVHGLYQLDLIKRTIGNKLESCSKRNRNGIEMKSNWNQIEIDI